MAQNASRAPDSDKSQSLWRSDIRPTLSLGLPLAGAQLAQMAINTTDVLMIGRLGAQELAASVLAFNFYMLVWFFGMGVLQAVIPLAARARGQKSCATCAGPCAWASGFPSCSAFLSGAS